jgi:hypothetical protein
VVEAAWLLAALVLAVTFSGLADFLSRGVTPQPRYLQPGGAAAVVAVISHN